MAVVLETSVGDITVDLYCEERPRCCENFLKLCKIKYYNFSVFHSVQRNLVAQTGDPTETGRGGESIFAKLYGEQAKFFDAENKPRIQHKKMGTVSMVNNGNNMHGSQFFMTLAADIDYLDGTHSVFGEVAEGLDTLNKINEAFTDDEHRPFKDIRIYHTVVLDDPFADPPRLAEFIPAASPEPTKEQLETVRIGVEEAIDENEGRTAEEVEEALQLKEAKGNAQILEMVGDLPSMDVKPEDNVLFVCKLNPVTTSEDLEIIFSRFGTIVSCEVIKDQKTEESLQYAFIEFEKESECENAYFKMDNVLIDDRRIHVDFSQSVSKLKYKGDQDSPREKYVIRDHSKKDKYGYVFSDDEDGARTDSKDRKGKSKSSKHARNSEKDDSDKQHKQKSNSRPESSKSRHRSRSRSRSVEKERRKDRSIDNHEHHSNKRQHKDHSREDYSTSKHHRSHNSEPRRRERHHMS